jgi:hypothetical protein
VTVAVHKIALLLHAVAAGVLVGSSTHLALQSLALLRGRANPRLVRLYPPVALAAWATAFTLGALSYPRYRIAVRYEYLDVHAVWASILFDIKENLALFVGPLLLGAVMMRRAMPEERERALRKWFAALCCAACAIAWWTTLSGLLITSVRSV